MSPEQWKRVSSALDGVLELAETERDQFLNKLRSDDPQLCSEVESLLQQHESTDLLESPPSALLTEVELIAGKDAIRPRQAGRYVIQDEIARGGMGAVLRAYDPDFQRTLAVKVLLPVARGDLDTVRRFLREAQITGRLQHPGIPPIHELGRLDDGSPFFAMKLIQGRTLAHWLTQRSESTDARLVSIFEQICRTLAYAHDQGIIHRDLKPSNIMVGAFGEVQVMDWGLTKDLRQADETPQSADNLDSAPLLSRAGDVSGTPAYMSPEQARGETNQLDERCDVFGLGGILCVMLTGLPPFEGSSDERIRASARGDVAPAMSRLDACGAEEDLISIAKKCLAAIPSERYRNAAEVADAITRYREGVQEKLKAAEMEREKAHVKIIEERRRRRVLGVLAAFVIMTVVCASGAMLWYQSEKAKIDQERSQQVSESAAQKKYLEKEIADALDVAEKSIEDLHAKLVDPRQVAGLLSKLDDWKNILDRSTAAWERAKSLAGGSKTNLDSELLARLDRLGADVKADREDYLLASEFDDIRTRASMLLPSELGTNSFALESSKRYADAFHKLGIDFANGEPSRISQAIKAMRVRLVLVSAIDQWIVASLVTNGNHWVATSSVMKAKQLLQKLTATARLVDGDPWRDMVRDPANWKKGKFAKLAAKADMGKLSPQFLDMVGELLFHVEGSVLPFLREAIARHPGDYWLQYNTARLVHSLYSPEKVDKVALRTVLACYQGALAIRPMSKSAYFPMGRFLELSGDEVGAAAYYKRAIALYPKDAWSHVNLGRIFAAKRQIKEAMAHFQTAVDLDPIYALAHSLLGKELVDSGDFERAIVHLEKAIQLAPDNASAHNNLGVAFRDKKNFDRAIQCFEKTIELQPNNAGAHNNLGIILSGRNDHEGALRCYEKALRIEPNQAQTHVNIGMILQDQGRIADAYRAYEKGERLGEKLPGWPRWIGERIRELKRPAELDDRLLGVLAGRIIPEVAGEWIELATFCLQQKKSPASAARLFQRAFEKDGSLLMQHSLTATRAAVTAAATDPHLSDVDRTELRKRALGWLQSKLVELEKNNTDSVRKELMGWKSDPQLASIRSPESLGKLNEPQRDAWRQFWERVDRAVKSRP